MKGKQKIANGSEHGYSTTDTANELVIEPGKPRIKVDTSEVTAKKKDATGGKKSKNFALEREKERVTKKMKRQLAAVKARKAKKLTQEELFASLAEYQLDAKIAQQLESSVHAQDKHIQIPRNDDEFPDKLDSVSKKNLPLPKTIHQKERIQENYYPTDDEASDSYEEDMIQQINKVAPASIEIDDDNKEEEAVTKVKMTKRNVKMTMDHAESEDDEETRANLPRKKFKTPKETSSNDADFQPSTSKEIEKPRIENRSYLMICRNPEIEEKRSRLPIYAEEVPIVEAINENTVTIICGETGSGKTTQLPQFLYEAGYTNEEQIIGITEPRRVAAISMAQRVGEELGLPDAVSYQIRYEGNRSEKTKILFMTDGILMKEMESDVMLNKYSAILIDEAHERSMYSDVLIGMLSRIAPLRAKTAKPLKLIIMSATLRLKDFLHERLFPSGLPRVIKVDARQYPVTVHFEKRTPDNYLSAAFRKICRIHESLPDGTILVFVSGQLEVNQLINKLKRRYPVNIEKLKSGKLFTHKRKRKEGQVEDLQHFKLENFQQEKFKEEPQLDGEDLLETGLGEDMWDDFDEDLVTDDDPLISTIPAPKPGTAPLYCLPLYSLLSTEKQKRVFEPPPKGVRICVVATNVAETSLTIPGVKYVVDTGFEKRRLFDPITGVSQFIVSHISQASADQRAGRAGRVAAGHAYRLYSSAVFQDFEQFSTPEIMDKPADQLVLHLKSMNIVKVVNFPFPSAPNQETLEAAEERLIKMGALSITTKNNKTEARITQLGKTLSAFPLAPAYAKVIVIANQKGMLPLAISLIAALSVREPMIPVSSLRGSNEEETKAMMTEVLKLRRRWCGKGPARRLGDLLVLLKAVAACEESAMIPEECAKLGLRYKAMQEIRRLRTQLTNIVNTTFSVSQELDTNTLLPSDAQAQIQMMIAGLPDCIAKRVERSATEEEIPRGAYLTTKLKEYVFIDPCSVIYTEEPDYVLYQDIIQLGEKKCMQIVMSVDHEWLPRLAESYCHFSEPDSEQEPRYDEVNDQIVKTVSVKFGPLQWPLDSIDKPIPHDITLYRYFAVFLLQGKIMPKLAEYVPKMLAPPITMVRSWSHLQKRTEALLNRLIDKEVHTRSALIDQFHKDENFLLEEYLSWLPESLHPSITLMWPPLEQKAEKMGRNKFYK